MAANMEENESTKNLKCSICGCAIHRDGDYARPTIKGRAHATRHHYVAERFFGRSVNRPKTERTPILKSSLLNKYEGLSGWFCYECHEELLHNPVILPEDIEALSELVRSRHLDEDSKTEDREKLSRRIELLQEIIHKGILAALNEIKERPER